MALIAFDTHAYVKELEAAGFSSSQAEGSVKILARAFKEAEEAQVNGLTTKTDLKALELKIDGKLIDLEKKIVELEKKIVETKTETIKWVAGMLIIQAGVLISGFFAIVKFLLAG